MDSLFECFDTITQEMPGEGFVGGADGDGCDDVGGVGKLINLN